MVRKKIRTTPKISEKRSVKRFLSSGRGIQTKKNTVKVTREELGEKEKIDAVIIPITPGVKGRVLMFEIKTVLCFQYIFEIADFFKKLLKGQRV